MDFKVTFLSAAVPLSKRFYWEVEKLKKTPYPLIKNVSTHTESVDSPKKFLNRLKHHAKQGHCLCKGNYTEDIVDNSRKGLVDRFGSSHWGILDIDGIPGLRTAEDFLALMPTYIRTTTCIVQYSASYGVDPAKGLSAHLYFLFREPVTPDMQKLWIKWLNLSTPVSKHIQLSATGWSLRWPIDVSVCDNSKLIYIAPPVLGDGVVDTFAGDRMYIIPGDREYLDIQDVPDAIAIDQRTDELIKAARTQKGLTARKPRTKSIAKQDVITNPSRLTFTEIKQDGEFMRFNVNGGDSWAYYHPVTNPEILYNFKDEPPVLIKTACPDYYAEAVAAAREPRSAENAVGGKIYLTFRDIRTDTYWNGHYDNDEDKVHLYKASSRQKLLDFRMENDLPVELPVPDWNYRFEFANDTVYDPERRTINMFQRSELLRQAGSTDTTEIPPTIQRVIQSITGGDPVVLDHFLNWLAVIVQKRRMTGTAWVLHGVPGTGKGIFFHHIMKPILGTEYVTIKKLADLEDQFNEYMQHCVLLMIDESSIGDTKQLSKLMNYVKHIITEPNISIRPMRANSFMAPNYLNIIFSSNKHDAVQVDANDRRFNIAPRQQAPLDISQEDIELLREELPGFVSYLLTRDASVSRARTPIHTEARADMQSLTRTSADITAEAILRGHLDFLVDQLPPHKAIGETAKFNSCAIDIPEAYRAVVRKCAESAENGKPVNLSREEIWVIFQHTVGDMPSTANKFTARVKHVDLRLKAVKVDGITQQGLKTEWIATTETLTRYKLLSQKPTLKAVN